MDDIIWREGKAFKRVRDGWKVKVWESRNRDLVTAQNEPLSDVERARHEAIGNKLIMINGKLHMQWNTAHLKGPVGGWKGTGQREVRISPRMTLQPVDYEADRHLWDAMDADGKDWNLDIDVRDLEDRAERSRKKSGQRAKTNCRHKIKHGGFRHLLTGTYRENMKDFDRMRRDFAAWVRKVRRVWKKFRSVWAFEPQQRGAWHFHATCDAPPRYLRHNGVWKPSYEVFTLLWQEVVGQVQYEFHGPLQPGAEFPIEMQTGGTINVDGYTKKNRRKAQADARSLSLAKMAGYVSKYLTKHLDEALFGRQMWGSTEDLTPPKAIIYEFGECNIADLIGAAFECPEGHRVARFWMNQWKDVVVLDTEPIPH